MAGPRDEGEKEGGLRNLRRAAQEGVDQVSVGLQRIRGVLRRGSTPEPKFLDKLTTFK